MTAKPRKTTLQKHLSAIAKKGGEATLKKHGPEHFRNIVKKRWDKKKTLKTN